jgi:hypothetical protein
MVFNDQVDHYALLPGGYPTYPTTTLLAMADALITQLGAVAPADPELGSLTILGTEFGYDCVIAELGLSGEPAGPLVSPIWPAGTTFDDDGRVVVFANGLRLRGGSVFEVDGQVAYSREELPASLELNLSPAAAACLTAVPQIFLIDPDVNAIKLVRDGPPPGA